MATSSPSIYRDLHDLFNSDTIKRKFFHFRILQFFVRKMAIWKSCLPRRPLPRADSAGSELSTKCATNCTRAVAA